eukprot:355627-Chlamydomonas_euryale.AAC.10
MLFCIAHRMHSTPSPGCCLVAQVPRIAQVPAVLQVPPVLQQLDCGCRTANVDTSSLDGGPS